MDTYKQRPFIKGAWQYSKFVPFRVFFWPHSFPPARLISAPARDDIPATPARQRAPTAVRQTDGSAFRPATFGAPLWDAKGSKPTIWHDSPPGCAARQRSRTVSKHVRGERWCRNAGSNMGASIGREIASLRSQ